MNKNDSGYILRWAKKIRAINLLGGCCSTCRNSNIFCLEFHHNKGAEKENTISYLLSYGSRWSEIKIEIEKCKLLCSNCHMEMHYGDALDKRRELLKYKLLEYKNKFSCEICGYVSPNNFISLDFHHGGDKNGNVHEIGWEDARRNASDLTDRLKRELDLCLVFCRNCHRIEHCDGVRFNMFKKDIFKKVDNYIEKPTTIDKERVIRMKKSGMKNIDIAREVGCAKSSVTYIINNNAPME